MAGNVSMVFGNGDSVNGGSSQPLESFFLSGSSSNFLGQLKKSNMKIIVKQSSSSMVSFKDVCGGGKRSERPFLYAYDQDENGDDDYDEYLHQPEKKRRLSLEQVQFLEKSFEIENKLEPERKVQLSKELGLQPRQVAIWFQNRRARWKTKQMEKDFDKLQANFNNLKSDYDSLLREKEKLKTEVLHLTDKLQLKSQENSEQPNLSDQLKTAHQEPNVEYASETDDQQLSIFGYNKQEDLSSAKSDVVDSDSSHYVEAGNSSSYAVEADQSDISQDDEDYLNKTFLPSSHVFPKIEDANPTGNPSHFVLSEDDQGSLFWPYWDINLKMPSSLHM